MITRADLEAMGVATTEPPTAGEWFVDADAWAGLTQQVRTVHDEYQKANPLEPGIPIDALRHRLGLPDRALAEALVAPPLTLRQGRVTTGAPAIPDQLRELVRKAFDGLDPFTAPEAYGLQALGFGPKQIGAAVRTGLLIQLAPQVVLKADAPERAAEVLRGLPQPFTLSQARQALGTTRRVAVPLLELLDRRGVTHRQPDDSRTVSAPGDPVGAG
jgi:selenocysteine-specific elongation factor